MSDLICEYAHCVHAGHAYADMDEECRAAHQRGLHRWRCQATGRDLLVEQGMRDQRRRERREEGKG